MTRPPKTPRAWNSSLPRRTTSIPRSPMKKRRRGTAAEQAIEDERKYGPPERRAWVKTEPCIVHGCPRPTENAHVVKIDGGMGRKSHYTGTAPVCRLHHTDGKHSLHQLGPRSFERLHGLDLAACAAETQRRWLAYSSGLVHVSSVLPHALASLTEGGPTP